MKIKDAKKSSQSTRNIKKLSKKQIETKNEKETKFKEETNVKKYSTNLSYLIPKEAQKVMMDQELPLANKNRNRKRKLEQFKPRVGIKKKEALENITTFCHTSVSGQTAISGSGQTAISGSGQTAISSSDQTSDSGQIAKKNKYRDKNRPSGSSGSGQTLVAGQTAISSYGQVSGSCQASGSGQTTKKNKKITLKENVGPTTCAICKKKFTRSADMQNHVAAIHEGKKPYQCPRCGMKFGQNSAVHLHFRKKHSEEVETLVSLQIKNYRIFSKFQ